MTTEDYYKSKWIIFDMIPDKDGAMWCARGEGYTDELSEAHHYSFEQACNIVAYYRAIDHKGKNNNGLPRTVMVPVVALLLEPHQIPSEQDTGIRFTSKEDTE